MTDAKGDPAGLWTAISEQLKQQGVDVDALASCTVDGSPVKVVAVSANLCESVDEMGHSARDQVLMVRVDGATMKTLDAWVQTGAVKSRSEAAALFLREGLGVRGQELAELGEALEGVDEAKKKLREKARKVLGTQGDGGIS